MGPRMVEGRTLGAFRDVIVIIGIAVLCFLGMQESVARSQARREQEARFALARNAMARMNEAYRQAIANKSINEQIFRQNELLIQYQELMVTLAYLPAGSASPAANKNGGGTPQPPKPQPPKQ
jgi:Tfp pilus assembly protein PilV